MVLEDGFNQPAIVIDTAPPLVSLEDALFLPRRHLCWDGFRSYRVGQVYEGGGREAGLFIRRMGDPKVTVLSASEGDLYQLCVRRHDLMELLE